MNNFQVILVLFLIVLVTILLFYFIRYAVMTWTGCDAKEATKMIHTAIRTSSPAYHIGSDTLLIQDLWDAIHTVIGDTRYGQLEQLSQHVPVFASGAASGLPYIALAVPYNNANEKAQVESLIRQKVERTLAIHGKPQRVLADWKPNHGLQMDMIVVQYAETDDEMKILVNTHAYNGNQLIRRNAPLRDKEIDDE